MQEDLALRALLIAIRRQEQPSACAWQLIFARSPSLEQRSSEHGHGVALLSLMAGRKAG